MKQKAKAHQCPLTFILISIFASLGFIFISQNTFAMSKPIPDYFTIQSVKVQQLSGSQTEQEDLIPTLPPSFDIVGVGQEIWSIISGNEPAVEAGICNFSALPKGETADDLENWSDPKTADFQVVYTNALGMNVASFNYTISFQYGGSLKGVGKYVAGASMVPSDISVDWGYKLDAEVQNFLPTNIGTDKNPVAMIQMAMKWTVTSVFEKRQQGVTYTLDGAGRLIAH